jgi:hypothetical protein
MISVMFLALVVSAGLWPNAFLKVWKHLGGRVR